MEKEEDNVVKLKQNAFEIKFLKYFKKEGFNYIFSEYEEGEMYITTSLLSTRLVNVTDLNNIANFSFFLKEENNGKRLKIDDILKGFSE